MTRRDRRSVGRIVLAAGSNAGLAALLGVITARSLGPGGQGTLTVITTDVVIVVAAMTLGTGASLRVRSVPTPSGRDVGAFCGLSLVMALIGGLMSCGLVALTTTQRLDTIVFLETLLLGAASLAAFQAGQLVQAYGKAAASILSAAGGIATQIALYAALAATGRASLDSVLFSAIVGAVTQAALGLASARLPMSTFAPAMHLDTWLALIRQGWPTIGYGLGTVAMQRIDRLILVAAEGPAVGGVYAVAASVAEIARIGSVAIGQLLFVRTAAAGGIEASTRHIYNMGVVLQVASLTAMATISPVLIPAVFGAEYASAVPLAQGLITAEFFLGIGLMDSRMILGLGRFAEVATATVTCVALALPAYWLLIAHLGAPGAVVGSLLVYATYSCFLLYRRRIHGQRPA